MARGLSDAAHGAEADKSCAAETSVKKIEDTFKDFTNRDDIAIILINQHVANMIRHLIDNYIQVRYL